MRPRSSLRFGQWLAAVLPFVAAGCGSSGPARTVSYFQAHPREREAVFARCANDPGTLGKSAECVNAAHAEAIAGIGSFRQLPPMAFPPVPRGKVKPRAGASDQKSEP